MFMSHGAKVTSSVHWLVSMITWIDVPTWLTRKSATLAVIMLLHSTRHSMPSIERNKFSFIITFWTVLLWVFELVVSFPNLEMWSWGFLNRFYVYSVQNGVRAANNENRRSALCAPFHQQILRAHTVIDMAIISYFSVLDVANSPNLQVYHFKTPQMQPSDSGWTHLYSHEYLLGGWHITVSIPCRCYSVY